MWNDLGSEIYADTSSHCWLSRFTTRRTHVGCRVGLKGSPILAPPLTSNNQLVGIAFDYLLRFYLERINVGSKTSVWAAEEGVILLGLLEEPRTDMKKQKVIWKALVICISHLYRMSS
jgi:hypothetical protein